MKAYTDIEQSIKLDKILPKDSYDMYLSRIDDGRTYRPHFGKTISIDRNMFSYRNGLIIPCWSLAALLNVLSSKFYPVGGHETILTLGKFPDKWCALYYDATGMQDGPQTLADNPVDCCVEMIIKNYEQNKERLQAKQEVE